jgi:YHS domain-containing protein
MPSSRYKVVLFFLYLSLFSWSTLTLSADEKEELAPLALQGYDPISYFRSDKVLTGKNQFQEVYKGKRYIFVSEENQQMFAAHPQQFLPQFGGYCAHSATAQNPVAGDPSIYVVNEGKLFLFSSEEAKSNWPVEINNEQVSLVPLALQGYDVTTYFGENAATKGNDLYQAVYNGKRYIFVSKENQQEFAKNPERFLPQFGGYCSHSVSQGKPIESNPAIYIVEQDNLFLFSREEARNAWTSQPAVTRAQAYKKWEFQANKRNNQIAAKNRWKKETKVKLFSF